MALNQVMYPGFAAYLIGLKSSAVEAAKPQELILDDVSEKEVSSLEKKQGDEALEPQQPGEKVESVDTSKVEAEKEPIEDMELPTIENE